MAMSPQAQGQSGQTVQATSLAALVPGQRATLQAIAADTWRFYGYDADVDPNTDLPRDNIGFSGAPAQGNYTSPTNIGVYLWSIVAAKDMSLITRQEELQRISRLVSAVERLRKWNGFLLSWYDTTNGHCLTGPGGTDCESSPLTGQFISTVDNGWYGAGLVVARQAITDSRCQACRDLVTRMSALLSAMDYGIFYDSGDQCSDITAGQMYGGYIADQGPGGRKSSAEMTSDMHRWRSLGRRKGSTTLFGDSHRQARLTTQAATTRLARSVRRIPTLWPATRIVAHTSSTRSRHTLLSWH